MDKVRINTCQRKFIFRGQPESVDPIRWCYQHAQWGIEAKELSLPFYNLHGDTYVTSNHSSGEFWVLSHATPLNSKPLVRGCGKSTGHSTQ